MMVEKTTNTYNCNNIKIKLEDFNLRHTNTLGLKLYSIELSKFQNLVDLLVPFLSAIEIERAEKFHFVNDKNRFIICRALLKLLLSEETGLNTNDLVINTTKNKKPYLPLFPNVFFNISHSKNYAIIAISKNPLGIDIEYINCDFVFNDMVSSVCNENEMNALNSSFNKHLTFYKLWTRKEAIVKATGTGIDDTLINIEALDGKHQTPTELLGGLKNLNVFSFIWETDYIASLAICIDIKLLPKIAVYPIPTTFIEITNAKL